MSRELLSAALLARGVLRRKSEDYLNWSAEDQSVLTALDSAVEGELDSLLGSKGDNDELGSPSSSGGVIVTKTRCTGPTRVTVEAFVPGVGGGE